MLLQLALFIFVLSGADGLLSISPSGITEVEENSRLTLTCSYTGSSSPTLVYWLKNSTAKYVLRASDCSRFGNAPDTASFEYNCTNGGRDFTLTFKDVNATQDGDTWSCRVNTRTVENSPEITIKIKAPTTTATTTTSSSTSSIGALVDPDPGPNLDGIISVFVATVAVIAVVEVISVMMLKATPGAPTNLAEATKTYSHGEDSKWVY